MTTALHLASPDDLTSLLTLVQRRHEETGQSADPEQLRRALTPLTQGGPEGAAYLLGPARAPVGYVLTTFAWSLMDAAYTAHIEDLYIRPQIRGRGIASEAIAALARALRTGGIASLRAALPAGGPGAGLARRTGFTECPETRQLRAKL